MIRLQARYFENENEKFKDLWVNPNEITCVELCDKEEGSELTTSSLMLMNNNASFHIAGTPEEINEILSPSPNAECCGG